MDHKKAPAVEDPIGVAEKALMSILRAASAIERRCEEVLAHADLSCAKFAALSRLVQAGKPLSLSELAEKLTCVRSNITQLVDRLQEDGLAQRIDNPADRRTKMAVVTSHGVERQAAGLRELQNVYRELGPVLAKVDTKIMEQILPPTD
jgi:DNA-binding MarR family transcriptional regulator